MSKISASSELLCVLCVPKKNQKPRTGAVADARSLICGNPAADTALLAVFDLFKLGIDDIIIGLARLAT